MGRWCLASALGLTLLGQGSAVPHGLHEKLLRIAKNESAKYNCSFSIAYRDASGSVGAAWGNIDGGSTEAQPADAYAFGSVTKMLTGSSIMRLISEGHLSLDSQVAPLVDALLADMASKDPSQGFASLADVWGADNITNLTVQQLLSMTSGVPDFDTATPCYTPGCLSTDPLRKDLYAKPGQSFPPTKLMAVDWVSHKWSPCTSRWPGHTPFCYSSTNFMLLGLILLAHQKSAGKVDVYTDLDQAAFLPDYLKKELQFAVAGPPSMYSPIHGFDRTSYNQPKGVINNHDNFNVSGVFSGWTASDVVASAGAIADLVYEIYGPPSSVAPKEFVDKMIPKDENIYGLATFNLNSNTGQTGKYGKAYGHLGATYGYQSVTAYFPELKFAMTVATNIETDFQAQPADAICFAYNAAAGLLLGKDIKCTYGSSGYYDSGCNCTQIEPNSTDVLMV